MIPKKQQQKEIALWKIEKPKRDAARLLRGVPELVPKAESDTYYKIINESINS